LGTYIASSSFSSSFASIAKNSNSHDNSRLAKLCPSTPQKKPLLAIQVEMNKSFMNVNDLKDRFIRNFQFQEKLPPVENISPLKENQFISPKSFKFLFFSIEDRAAWIEAMKKHPSDFRNPELLNLMNPKIIVEGVPKAFAELPTLTVVNTMCKVFNLKKHALQYLFKTPTQRSSSDYYNIVFATQPDARRYMFSKNDTFYFEEQQFTVGIRDFHQPIQCMKCSQLEHTTSRCPLTNITCRECCSVNCTSSKNFPCPNKQCLLCGGTDHTGFEKLKCPRYRNIINDSKERVYDILCQTCPPNSRDLLQPLEHPSQTPNLEPVLPPSMSIFLNEISSEKSPQPETPADNTDSNSVVNMQIPTDSSVIHAAEISSEDVQISDIHTVRTTQIDSHNLTIPTAVEVQDSSSNPNPTPTSSNYAVDLSNDHDDESN
jgi:hypothetical protein